MEDKQDPLIGRPPTPTVVRLPPGDLEPPARYSWASEVGDDEVQLGRRFTNQQAPVGSPFRARARTRSESSSRRARPTGSRATIRSRKMELPAVFVRTSDQNYVVAVELKPTQNAYRQAAALDGPSLEAYLTRGPKNPTPSWQGKKVGVGPTVFRAVDIMRPHVQKISKTLISSFLCAPSSESAAEWIISDSFVDESEASKAWEKIWSLVTKTDDPTHFNIIVALSKFLALYKDDYAKERMRLDLKMFVWDESKNTLTNELALHHLFEKLASIALQTQDLPSGKKMEMYSADRQFEFLEDNLSPSYKKVYAEAKSKLGHTCTDWAGLIGMLVQYEETAGTQGKGPGKPGVKLHALHDIDEIANLEGLNIAAVTYMGEQQRAFDLSETYINERVQRASRLAREVGDWSEWDAINVPAYACRPCLYAPLDDFSAPLHRMGVDRPIHGPCWRCGMEGHGVARCASLPSPEEMAGLHYSQWSKVAPTRAVLPPPAHAPPSYGPRHPRAAEGAATGRGRGSRQPATPSYGRPSDRRPFSMPVPRAPVAPLHTMVSFVPDVEDGGFAQMAQENQQRLWDMEDTANYWREKAMAHRTVVQRVTQDVSRLSEPALFQLAARAPPEPYQRTAPEDVTPLLLAETAPPDWVHVGRYLDTNTKLYQSYKDHQLTINALSASRAAREVATEDMFYECEDDAVAGNAKGV